MQHNGSRRALHASHPRQKVFFDGARRRWFRQTYIYTHAPRNIRPGLTHINGGYHLLVAYAEAVCPTGTHAINWLLSACFSTLRRETRPEGNSSRIARNRRSEPVTPAQSIVMKRVSP
jgi:hypothetical protein